MMAGNVVNLAFNAFMSRALTFEQLGLITLVNTFFYIASVLIFGINASVNQRVSYITARDGIEAGIEYTRVIIRKVMKVVTAAAVLWVIASPAVTTYFRLPTIGVPLAFTPVIILGALVAMYEGYLRGRFLFIAVGIVFFSEAFSKLLVGVGLVLAGLKDLAYLSIPLAIVFSTAVGYVLSARYLRDGARRKLEHDHKFPFQFFFAAIFTSLAANSFLTFDVLLSKHYLAPKEAGIYAFLSLVGKMIYFVGSLFNAFIISFVSRDEGARRDPNIRFYVIFSVTTIFTVAAFGAIGLFGLRTLPILFGDKVTAVRDYLLPYGLAISLFTIGSTIVNYHLARRHYVFPVIAILFSLSLLFRIAHAHSSIAAIVNVVLEASIQYLLVMIPLHLLKRNGRHITRNIVDFFGLFAPLPKLNYTPLGKRILIFNWRDMKHSFAGGAELYLHELGKRWVQMGCKVTLFCGNDGHNPRYEIVDGIQVVRRGGFYMVYIWAALYYLLRFRGKYDIIIDSENGVPFFTPLYAKEKIYLLMHHVHQEVFRRTLRFPLSTFAEFMEIRMMPYVYQSVPVITVSPSTKREIESKQLSTREPIIIYNGVDLTQYVPGTKSRTPLIVYLGRLKKYKSIDVFIRAAAIIKRTDPDIRFVIAGDGEEAVHLHAAAKRADVEVEFLGKISDEQKIALYQKAWIAVNPSSMEGWGITSIEANACGTPVVASDVPGLRDSVKDGVSGFLVPYGDEKALARKLSQLLADKKLLSKLRKSCRTWASRYSWDVSMNQTLKLFNGNS